MLKITRNVTFTGKCVIDDVQVATFTATVSTNNAGSVSLIQRITNEELWTANKDQCAVDRAEFEATVYDLQDGVLSAKYAGDIGDVELAEPEEDAEEEIIADSTIGNATMIEEG